MKFDSNGFLITDSWKNYEFIKSELENIKSEFFTSKVNIEELKIHVGYKKVWYSEVVGATEMANAVEKWIINGGFHKDQIGYDSRGGEWNTFPLYKKDDEELNNLTKILFPNINKVLDKIPNLNFAAIFKQPSGATIRPHKHVPKNLICHFLLNNLKQGNAWFKVGNNYKHMKNMGDAIGFDYRIEHSTGNESRDDRINFVVDVKRE